MKYKVILSAEAYNDIDGIFRYISDVLCEREIAVNLIEALKQKILSLDEMPARHRIYDREPWKSCGVHILPVKKYLVFYVIDKDNMSVNVLRIIYSSRDFEKLI